MGWPGFLKGVSAVIIAIALLLGGSVIFFQFLVAQFTAPPPRPTFSNDQPAAAPPKPNPVASPSPAASPAASPSPPAPSPSPSPPDSQRARITLNDGLNVRQAASADSERVDGVDLDDEVVILAESPDREWIKVRVERSGAEGWIKSGYTEPIPSTNPQ